MTNDRFAMVDGERLEIGPRAECSSGLIDAVFKQFSLGPALEWNDLGEYVIRVYRPWVVQSRLEQLRMIKASLANAGFPVSQPMSSVKGDSNIQYQDRLVEVELFIHHNGVPDSWPRYAIAMSLLGKLHDFLAMNVATNSFIRLARI
jgi:hypothetical protein